jgi:hypothetical protein
MAATQCVFLLDEKSAQHSRPAGRAQWRERAGQKIPLVLPKKIRAQLRGLLCPPQPALHSLPLEDSGDSPSPSLQQREVPLCVPAGPSLCCFVNLPETPREVQLWMAEFLAQHPLSAHERRSLRR